MNIMLRDYAKNNLNLDEQSRNFNYVLARAEKIFNDLLMFESAIPKKINKIYGRKQAAIAFTLLKIQKDAIEKNKSISMPSLKAMAIAFMSSITHIRETINKLIDKGLLHIKSYWDINEVTGEINTRTDKLNRRFKNTDGRLRKIINPFKGIKTYIRAKKSERKRMIEETTLKSQFAIDKINSFYSSQKE